MKQLKLLSFATALLFVTAMLIAAFIILFSYSGHSLNDESKGNPPGNALIVNKPAS
jgi:hypothetical protein